MIFEQHQDVGRRMLELVGHDHVVLLAVVVEGDESGIKLLSDLLCRLRVSRIVLGMSQHVELDGLEGAGGELSELPADRSADVCGVLVVQRHSWYLSQ